MFSYISIFSDKVILTPTGPSLTCFNNDKSKNKYIMIFDYSKEGNPFNCPYCKHIDGYLCTNKFDWFVKILPVDIEDNITFDNNLCNSIENFITL